LGHYCRICGRQRPNERFSGKGHKTHICKECARKPKAEIEAIEQGDEILGFLEQSHISKKNISRLKILSRSTNKDISEFDDMEDYYEDITNYYDDITDDFDNIIAYYKDKADNYGYFTDNSDDLTDYYEYITDENSIQNGEK
jgi:hypothetical protein